MKPTSIAFEERYSDNSGVEYGVYLVDGQTLKIKGPGSTVAELPIEKLEWLMEALDFINDVLPEDEG